MLYDNIELFNVEDTEKFDNGVILQRFTKEALNDTECRATWMASAATGVEIRFVADTDLFL